MATWERAARSDDVRGEGPHAISAGGVDLVLVRARSGLKVYEGRCPHQGALLGEGEIEGGSLVCRNHRWRYDLETGQRTGGRQCLRACPVKEEAGEILVDVTALAAAEASAKAKTGPLRRVEDLPGPPGRPFLGNAYQFRLEELHLQLEAWSRTYGPMYRFSVGPRTFVVVKDPAIAEPMQRARPETYRRPAHLEKIFEEMHVAGVFSAEGDAWRAQRRLAMEALSQRHLRGFYPTLEMVARRLVRRWQRAAEAGRVMDLPEELKLFTVDVTTLLVFGHDVNTLEKEEEDVIQRQLEQVFPAFHRRLSALLPYWRYFRLPEDRRLDRAIAELIAWLTPLLDAARERLEREPERAAAPANFLEAMLAAKDADGRPFSNDVLFGNAMTMLLAGEDTTAYSVAWAVHLLLDAPHAARELRAEVDEVLPRDARVPVDLEQANRLTYATAVANEAMRLRPVAPTAFLQANHDVVVGDVAAPKGTLFTILARLSAVSAEHFDRPDVFRPERWIEGTSSGKAHDASASMPFGSGPRICPGRSLALVEMRVLLATLYRSFDVERVGRSEDVKEVTAFTMVPEGLRVKLRKRG